MCFLKCSETYTQEKRRSQRKRIKTAPPKHGKSKKATDNKKEEYIRPSKNQRFDHTESEYEHLQGVSEHRQNIKNIIKRKIFLLRIKRKEES